MIPDYEAYLIDIVHEMTRPWPENRAVNIVCHGHSVPAGYFATPVVDTLAAYPHQVLIGLKERFANAVVNVIVTAVGGENAEQGAARFVDEVLSHRPDVVTLDYALNDRRIGLLRAKNAWREMMDQALARNMKVILLTPTHDVLSQRTGEKSWSEELPRYAEQVRQLAAEYGVGLADSYAAFERYIQSGGHILDLLAHVNHPNRLGHQLVARELLRWFPAQ
jgi:lysophospholipase L1-like esterase